MRKASFSSVVVFALSACLVGACGGAPQEQDSESEAAAAPLRTITIWCLEVDGHGRNGDQVVYTLDVTSAFGPPRERLLTRSKAFYWHNEIMSVRQPAMESWVLGAVNEVDGYHARAESEVGAVDIELQGEAGVGVGVTGFLHITPHSGQEERISIVGGSRCPSH